MATKESPETTAGGAQEESHNIDMQSTMISLFPSALAKEPDQAITLRDLLAGVKSGTWKNQIDHLRDLVRAGNRVRYDQKKRELPAVTLSCHCLSRELGLSPEEKAVTHSGWLQADFDLKDNPALTDAATVTTKRADLLADPHVGAVFVGPSGEGLKAVVRIDGDRHKDSWLAAESHFKTAHGLKLDRATKDHMRLCFVSYDPDLATSEDACPLPLTKTAKEQAATSAKREISNSSADESQEKTTPPNPKDWIILPTGEVGNLESAHTAYSALMRSGRFYRRGGRVVELITDNGTATLDILESERLRSSIERCGVVAAWGPNKKGDWVLKPNARVRKDSANLWLASEAKNDLFNIETVSSVPLLIERGPGIPFVTATGYNKERGIFITGNCVIRSMTIDEARDTLKLLLQDFDYVTPSDRSRALAAFITPALVAGGTLGAHSPMFCVEADGSQTGKGYKLELVQKVYGEPDPAFVTKKKGGVGSLDESIQAALVRGRSFIQLDNVRNRIDSELLESAMTLPMGATFMARLPFKGEIAVRPDRFIFQLTSNGVETTSDLANRCCFIRIKNRGGYVFTKFTEGDIAAHVAANQSRFLSAIYHVVSRWIDAGKPGTADARAPGRFRRWGQSLDWMVQRVCGEAPLLDGHQDVQQRTSNPALSWMRVVAQAVIKKGDVGDLLTASNLVELCAEEDIQIPGLGKDASDTVELQTTGRVLGKVFKTSDSVEIEGITCKRIVSEERGENGRASKTYTFHL